MKCDRKDMGNDTTLDFCICGEDLCNKDMGPMPTVTTNTAITTTPNSGPNMIYYIN